MSDIDAINIRKLDGGLLLVFRELMRQGRATAAGERLGLSQSGVSHALGRLREVFGDPLFLRRPHGLVPTRRALDLAPRIELLISLTQEVMGGQSAFDPAASRRQFHIGAADFVTSLICARLLSRLEAAAPGVSVAFRTLVGAAAFDALRRGEIDLALGRFARPPATLHAEPLFSDRYAVVGRSGHRAFSPSMSLAGFAAAPHVMVTAGPQPLPVASGVLAELGVTRRVLAVVPNFVTAFAIAAETDALVTAPRPLAMRYAPIYSLEVAETPFPSPLLEMMLVRRNEAATDLRVSWLIGQIRAAAPENDQRRPQN